MKSTSRLESVLLFFVNIDLKKYIDFILFVHRNNSIDEKVP